MKQTSHNLYSSLRRTSLTYFFSVSTFLSLCSVGKITKLLLKYLKLQCLKCRCMLVCARTCVCDTPVCPLVVRCRQQQQGKSTFPTPNAQQQHKETQSSLRRICLPPRFQQVSLFTVFLPSEQSKWKRQHHLQAGPCQPAVLSVCHMPRAESGLFATLLLS